MNRAIYLREALLKLFRSGADGEHDEEEMEELLDGIDFSALLQALRFGLETVYMYRADGLPDCGLDYRGPELFPVQASLLYTGAGDLRADMLSCARFHELWLLDNMTVAVVSCFRTEIGNCAYTSEFRAFRGLDWRNTDMEIDFVRLADKLDALCEAVRAHELPVYEL